MQPAALQARSIGVMQQATQAACIIYKHSHATEQHFACHPKVEACCLEHSKCLQRLMLYSLFFNESDFWLGT